MNVQIIPLGSTMYIKVYFLHQCNTTDGLLNIAFCLASNRNFEQGSVTDLVHKYCFGAEEQETLFSVT